MRRSLAIPAALTAVLSLPAFLGADVTTKEKVTFKLEGLLGHMVNTLGAGSRDGLVSTVALKGQRLARINETTGQIIDLGEQKVYELDMKKKEYRIKTFDEMRRELQEARDRAAQQASHQPTQNQSDAVQQGKQIEFEADVKDTGQHKSLAGYDAHEVILTVTGHEKGKTLEEGGGFVMTNDIWLGPKIAALDEIAEFQRKYVQAVYGQALEVDPQQMAALSAMMPSFQRMAQQMEGQSKKLQGTPLLTTTVFESVKSAEEMRGAAAPASEGGGVSNRLGGMLARKMRGPAQQRSTVLTTGLERMSIEPSASADAVALPSGFKEKK